MKKLILSLCCLSLLISCSQPLRLRNPASTGVEADFEYSKPAVQKSLRSILIKLKKSVYNQIKNSIVRTNHARKRIYQFPSHLSVATFLSLNQSLGVTVISGPWFDDEATAEQVELNLWFELEFAFDINPDTVVTAYSALSSVELAVSNDLLHTMGAPNDPYLVNQWGHANTKQMNKTCYSATIATQTEDPACSPTTKVGTVGFDGKIFPAWDQVQSFGDAQTVIAILDTGVSTHPDLSGRLLPGTDIGDNDNDPTDPEGHGTMCAGVVAAAANNGTGIAGVCPDCRIVPVKVMDQNGAITNSYLTNGVLYAADRGDVKIMSMSLGVARTEYNSVAWTQTEAAFKYASIKGKLMFAATGNDNDDFVAYPARSSYVQAIGASSPCSDNKGGRKRSGENRWWTSYGSPAKNDMNGVTCDGQEHWGSNYAPSSVAPNAADAVDFIAPTIIPATTNTSGYTMTFNGTSAATPFAAGVAALVMSNLDKRSEPSTAEAVISKMRELALDVQNIEGSAGWDRFSGHGLVNLNNLGNIATTGEGGVFALNQNYPNPTKDFTTIKFSVPYPQEVRMVLYDMLGREIRILFKGYIDEQQQVIKVDLSELASAVYIYTLYQEDKHIKPLSKKVLLLK